MLSPDDIAERHKLLAIHRLTLAVYRKQQAELGMLAPPGIANGIADTCEHIRQIKADLRASGAAVEDLPDDDLSPILPISRLSEPERRNRSRMLEKVRLFWIKGVLEQSLHGAALIDLGMQYKPDAVDYPWDMIFQRPDQPDEALQPGTKIADVFDAQGGELLILGAPGAGKTTMLLELARELIARAEQDARLPMPVVFNLSSWAEKRPALSSWLVDELSTRYQVPRKIGAGWVAADLVLPLLDGLDEVEPESRAACVEAINSFRQEHGMIGLVVCSRSTDYADLRIQLKIQGAILLQPLTSEQIDDYLARAGEHLSAVRIVLQEDPTLQELAETPLMLSIISLAYQRQDAEALRARHSLEDRRRHLFDTYVRRMFERRGVDRRYPEQKVIHWLAWLARTMEQRAQTNFFIEELQPDLLPVWRQRLWYSVNSLIAVTLGLGLLWLVFLPLLLWRRIVFDENVFQFSPTFSPQLENGLIVVLGVTLGVVAILAILGILTMMLRCNVFVAPIKVAEALNWSWVKALPWFAGGMFISQLLVWRTTVQSVLTLGSLTLALAGELGVGLLAGAILGLAGGLSSSKLELTTTPNQGIWLSARNGLRVWLASGAAICIGVLFLATGQYLLSSDSLRSLTSSLFSALPLGVGGGLLFVGPFLGLAKGGMAWIRHFELRWKLYRNGYLPWRYARFLNYASERLLLRRVGGGYIFIHRLLLEYFAALYAEPTAEVVSQPLTKPPVLTAIGTPAFPIELASATAGVPSDVRPPRGWRVTLWRIQPKINRALRMLLALDILLILLAIIFINIPDRTLMRTLHAGIDLGSLTFSSDGQILVSDSVPSGTSSSDKLVQFWSIRDGKRLQTVEHVASINFAPNKQTAILIFNIEKEKKAQFYHVNDGRLLQTVERASNYYYSRDGQSAILWSEDKKTVWLCRVRDGAVLQTVEHVARWFRSPDEQIIAMRLENEQVKMYRLSDGALLQTVEHVARWFYSPDNQIIVMYLDDTSVKMYRVSDGALLQDLEQTTYVTFAPDSQIFASGRIDGTVQLWRMSDLSHPQSLIGHTDEIRDMTFSPDGQILASAAWDATIRWWRVRDGALLRVLPGQEASESRIKFSPDSQIFASASDDQTIQLWRVGDGALLHSLRLPDYYLDRISFAPDSKTLAAYFEDEAEKVLVQLWHVRDGARLALPEQARKVVFSPDGQAVVSYSKYIPSEYSTATALQLWRTSDGALLKTIPNSDSPTIFFSFDGKIAIFLNSYTLQFWRANDGSELLTVKDNISLYITWTSDRQAFAARTYEDDSVRLWRARDGALLYTLQHPATPSKPVFSPDG